MSRLFDFVADAVEQKTELAKLEARGTLRLALKDSGFNADSITTNDMAVVLEQVMPKELASRGIDDAESVCNTLSTSLREFKQAVEEHGSSSPESVFARLAGN
ncbi:MAG: hypothetical protein JRG80_00020 [Deltaproteobacteria bacterium]|nr:hypothetical protein [Deltaproteobacteria bacterium]